MYKSGNTSKPLYALRVEEGDDYKSAYRKR